MIKETMSMLMTENEAPEEKNKYLLPKPNELSIIREKRGRKLIFPRDGNPKEYYYGITKIITLTFSGSPFTQKTLDFLLAPKTDLFWSPFLEPIPQEDLPKPLERLVTDFTTYSNETLSLFSGFVLRDQGSSQTISILENENRLKISGQPLTGDIEIVFPCFLDQETIELTRSSFSPGTSLIDPLTDSQPPGLNEALAKIHPSLPPDPLSGFSLEGELRLIGTLSE